MTQIDLYRDTIDGREYALAPLDPDTATDLWLDIIKQASPVLQRGNSSIDSVAAFATKQNEYIDPAALIGSLGTMIDSLDRDVVKRAIRVFRSVCLVDGKKMGSDDVWVATFRGNTMGLMKVAEVVRGQQYGDVFLGLGDAIAGAFEGLAQALESPINSKEAGQSGVSSNAA